MYKISSTLSITALLLVFTSALSQELATEVKKTSASQADQLIRVVNEKENFPGLAIEVWKNGKSVFSEGYGYADIDNKIQVNPRQSLFRIGSVSKPYTAAALALLYEAKEIDLDVPIQVYVPSFPEKRFPITLRQLAGHLAGIRHYRGVEFMSNRHYPTVTEGLAIFQEDDLLHEPGTKYAYSSYGWNLISAAIESASDEEFLTFMKEKVFEALEMSNTRADDNTKTIPNKVVFYNKNSNGNHQVAPPVDNSYKWAGGGYLSTVEDMAKFAQAHLDATFLQKATIELWTTSQQTKDGKPTNYGIGWRSGIDKKGRTWFGHTGGSVGGSSILIIFPDENVIVAMAINLTRAQHGNLAFRVAEQFFDNPSDLESR